MATAGRHPDEAFCSTKGFQSGPPCLNSSSAFWLSEPNPYLIGYRSSEQVPSQADVVIVGSGITGASAARFISEDARANGMKICLLEAREVCWGATGRNGGHCQPLLFNRGLDIGAFELRNIEEVESYITKHDVPCEWRKTTSCINFWTQETMEKAEARVADVQKTKPELGKLMHLTRDKETLKKCRVSTKAIGAVLTQGAASLWPYKLVTFMVEKIVRENKISLYTQTPVTSIECATSKCTVTTPRGKISAKHVVLATNGYTSHLLPEFGSLIVPIRCEMSALLPPRNSTRLPNTYGFVANNGSSPDHNDYLMQRPYYSYSGQVTDGNNGDCGGHLMFGGGRDFAEKPVVGQWEDSLMDQGEASYLRKELLRALTLDGETDNLTELTASHQWTGIKGYSRDTSPWVGPVPGKAGVWIAAAYTGHGMPNATLCGKAVINMLLAQEEGQNLEKLLKKMVEGGDLPEAYICSETRLQKALTLPSVEECDKWENLKEGDIAANKQEGKCDLM